MIKKILAGLALALAFSGVALAQATAPIVLNVAGQPMQAQAHICVDLTGAYVGCGSGVGPGGGAVTGALGSFVDGWDVTEGKITDSAWSGSGNGTVTAYLRAIATQALSTNPSGVSATAASFADGWNVTLGAAADSACGTDTGTCTQMALTKRLIQKMTTSITALGSPLQAGGNIGNAAFAWSASEVHGGEVGGNELTVTVAQTVTASSAYVSGNAIGGLMTIANATRVSGSAGASGTTGMLQSVVMTSKSAQTTQVDVFMFNANPSGSTCTDKTAFSLAAADLGKVIGVASIPSTGWFSGGTASLGQAFNLAKPFALSSSTTVYACAVTRSTPTYASTSDIAVNFDIIRN